MKIQLKRISFKAILITIAIGVWVIALQNTGLIPTNQHVKVVNTIDTNAEVSGTVSVDNTVDVNIHEINGYNTVTTGNGTHSVFPYGYTLAVDTW
jgi:hypothetical protein